MSKKISTFKCFIIRRNKYNGFALTEKIPTSSLLVGSWSNLSVNFSINLILLFLIFSENKLKQIQVKRLNEGDNNEGSWHFILLNKFWQKWNDLGVRFFTFKVHHPPNSEEKIIIKTNERTLVFKMTFNKIYYIIGSILKMFPFSGLSFLHQIIKYFFCNWDPI